MKVSLDWLSDYVDLNSFKSDQDPKGANALSKLLTNRGLEVDAIHDLSAGFEKVITAQIKKKDSHPDADRLSLCLVNTGSEELEIVCGATNMKAGDKVALAQIGAELPNGMKIKKGKIRGVVSHGMLCSESELGMADESEGILILPEDSEVGTPVAKVLGREDVVLELGLTPDRGDCLSHRGVAREIASHLGVKINKREVKVLDFESGTPIELKLNAGEEGPQFYGAFIEGVKVGTSPDWMVERLEAVGLRAINNVVDATNYLLMDRGHPTHAYDADLIEGNVLSIEESKKGEVLPLLDGSEVKLTGDELVIADGSRAVALAGVMGGGNSEVRDETKRIYLECAEFDPVRVRKASSRFQIHSDASHRFERAIDPNQLHEVVSQLAGVIVENAGGEIKGATRARSPSRSQVELGSKLSKIELSPVFVREFLGFEVTDEEIRKSLEALEFGVSGSGNSLLVEVPSHRNDVTLREDLASEVARFVGYDRIPSKVPALTDAPTSNASDHLGTRFELLMRAKESLARQGLAEILDYAWSSNENLAAYGLKGTVPVENPMSEEQEMLVPSLVPGIVKALQLNWNHHFGSEVPSLRLFQIRPTFHSNMEGPIRAQSQTDPGLREEWRVCLAMTGLQVASGLKSELRKVDFYDLKSTVENFLEDMGARGVRILEPKGDDPVASCFHPGQSAQLVLGKEPAGWFGRLHPRLEKSQKAKSEVWLAELNWDLISRMSRQIYEAPKYKSFSEFPGIERDFSLVVKESTKSDQITQVALKAGRPLAKVARVFDIYRGEPLPEGMTSVSVRVIFSEEGRSLQEAEAESSSEKILSAWREQLNAELR